LIQSIVIPSFTFRAVEATVLNCLSFGQTDLISRATLIGEAAAIDFDHEDIAGKLELCLLPRHVNSL